VTGARYADHRLVASMIGNMAVYAALTQPGDPIMSVTQPFGGHSSNRTDGPAGIRGLRIGTTEVTRWGMMEPEMARIADLIAELLHGRRSPEAVRQEAIALRRAFPELQYCFG
jgi:glycine/serine hydroxymethyltransferase